MFRNQSTWPPANSRQLVEAYNQMAKERVVVDDDGSETDRYDAPGPFTDSED